MSSPTPTPPPPSQTCPPTCIYSSRPPPSPRYFHTSWLAKRALYNQLQLEYLHVIETWPWWAEKRRNLEAMLEATRAEVLLVRREGKAYEKRMKEREAEGLAAHVEEEEGRKRTACPGHPPASTTS